MGIKDTILTKLQNRKVKIALLAVVFALVILGVAYVIFVLPGMYATEGDSYMVSGLYEDAISAYDKSLTLRPNNGITLSHKGDALLGLSAHDAALATYEKAAKNGVKVDWETVAPIFENAGRIDLASQAQYYLAQENPSSIFTWYKLGELQSQLQEYEKAAASYDYVARLTPYSATVWLRKAETLAKLSYYPDAIEAYNRAISLEPKLLIAYLRKADLQEDMGDLIGALATVDKALDENRDSVQGWLRRYNLLMSLDRFSEAVTAQQTAQKIQERYVPGKKIEYQDFSDHAQDDTRLQKLLLRQAESILLDPFDSDDDANNTNKALPWLLKAYVSNLQGAHGEAVRMAKQAVALDPSDSIATAAWTNLGYAYTSYKDYPNAEKAYLHAIKADPENQVALFGLADVYYKKDQYHEAILAADQALEQDVGDEGSWLVKGLALADSGNRNEAYIALSRAKALNPQNPETLSKLTEVLYEIGDVSEALDMADQTISLAPHDASAWFYRARALFDFEQYSPANEAFDRAIQLAPNNADAWYEKGKLYETLGKTSEALSLYDQARSLRPDDPALEEAYTNVYAKIVERGEREH